VLLAATDCRPTCLRRRVSRPQLKRDPLGSDIIGVRLITTRHKRIILAAARLITAALFIWVWTTPRVGYAPAVARCREFYGSARTRLDSARVDGTAPFERTPGDINPIRCGDLRAAGLISREAS